MFRIIASDLDGTLLNPKNQLTPFTKKIIKKLDKNKIHFILATGRHYINTIPIYKNINIHSYIISSNGNRIHDSSGRIIFARNLRTDIASDLLQIVYDNQKITTNIFHNDQWLVNRITHNHQKINYQNKKNTFQIYKKNKISLNNICKLYFTSYNYQQLFLLEKKLNIRWKNQINTSFSLPTCLEIMPKGISKGSALKKVANLLGYQLKDCISFGDGMNDQEMLSMSGKGCLMSNSQLNLKKNSHF